MAGREHEAGISARRVGWAGAVALVIAALVAPGTAAFASKPGPGSGGSDGAAAGSFSTPPATCGQSSQATATFTNTGSTTWSPSSYHLTAVPVGSTTWGPSTVALSATVGLGQSVTFSWMVTTPSTSGSYSYSWQMANGSSVFGPPISTTVTNACAIGDVFAGKSQLVDDPSFTIPVSTFQNLGTPGHSDTSTVDLGPNVSGSPRFLMFYRTFVSTWTANGFGIPAGIALATSTDGNSWAPVNGGAAVLPDRPATAGSSPCSPDVDKCVVAVYAPSVIVEGTTLTMAYEVMDTTVPGGGSAPRNWIEAATSTDHGMTWHSLTDGTGVAKVVVASQPWEGLSSGQNRGNVGTPDLRRDAAGYVLGYHGFSGTSFARGTARGSNLLSLQKDANPNFVGAAGWTGTGPGKAADTTEGAYTYRLFEAFNGGSGCVTDTNEVGWGVARSTDGATWTYSSVNPIRTDRVGYSCGEDMPAWQIINGVPHVLVTRLNDVPTGQSNIRRYAISASTPQSLTTGSSVIGIVSQPGKSGYWEVDSSGGIFNFGGASAYPAVSGGGSPFTGVAVRPTGDGLWLVTASGHVATAGSAVAYGNATVRKGATAVAIEGDASGGGYWVVLSTGAVQRFGDAPALTLSGGGLRATPVAITRSPSTSAGFWLMDSGGTIASYGAATAFAGPSAMSAGAVGFGATGDGGGGWVVDARGRVYPVGNAVSFGDTTSGQFGSGYQPFAHFAIVGMSQAVGSGYYLVATDGGVIDFGAATYLGHVRALGSSS